MLQQRDKDTFITLWLSHGCTSSMLAFPQEFSSQVFFFSDFFCNMTCTHLRGQLLSVNFDIVLSWATVTRVREGRRRLPQRVAVRVPLAGPQPQPPEVTTVYVSSPRVA